MDGPERTPLVNAAANIWDGNNLNSLCAEHCSVPHHTCLLDILLFCCTYEKGLGVMCMLCHLCSSSDWPTVPTVGGREREKTLSPAYAITTPFFSPSLNLCRMSVGYGACGQRVTDFALSACGGARNSVRPSFGVDVTRHAGMACSTTTVNALAFGRGLTCCRYEGRYRVLHASAA